jgi:hypothetical protein
MEKLIKSTTPLTSTVQRDAFIVASERAFDCAFDGVSKFYPWGLPNSLPNKFKIGVIVGSSGCLGLGTKVLMFNGDFKAVEEVVVGDVLMGPDSKPRNVLKLFRGKEQMYLIKQNKGVNYRVNESHILSLKNRKTKSIRKTINGKREIISHVCANENDVTNISVIDYLNKSENFKNTNKGYKAEKLLFNNENEDLKIDPYFLGLWLGDGDSNKICITNIDKEILEYIENYSNGLNLQLNKTIKDKISRYHIHDGRTGRNNPNILLKAFKEYNLLNNKHIPKEFIISSEKNRLELLAGLLDTDGSYNCNRNYFEITQKNKILADNITFLARSLGFYVSNNESIRKIKSINFEGVYYRICIYGNLDIIPTKLNRKKAKISSRNTNWLVTGIKIEKDIVDDYYGFMLDGDNLFLLEDLTVTHNSGKSTLLKKFGIEESPDWDINKSILSHFESPDEAINKMGAVGLNTIPSWYKPYQVLSNGEKFRADVARKLKSNAVIDEFTSVVDRNVAKAASVSLSRYIKNNDIENIVLSTCHRDILEWLEPDWVIDTDAGEFQQGFFLSGQKSKLKFTQQVIISGPCLKTIII